MKKFLLLIVVFAGLSACEKETKEFLRSYVMRYYDAGELVLKGSYENSINIYFTQLSSLGNYKSTGTLKESYDALCEKHNDMTFLRDFVVSDAYGPHSTDQLGIDFVSLDITSNADFDAGHPAGASLGDVIRLNSYSLKPFIDSGYVSFYNSDVYHPVYVLVSELVPDQLILLGQREYIGTLMFEKNPDLSKTHTFMVTMTADDGRVFTASIDVEFE